jgi:prepilin-type processing-associated H-X9-DG protein
VTHVEVVVVLCLFFILIGLFLPATRRVRGAAQRTQCINNLKQLMLAFHNYQSTGSYQATGSSDPSIAQMLPPGCSGPGATPEDRLSWMVALLPYLEQDSLYRQLDLHKGYEGNLPAVQVGMRFFVCPPQGNEAGTEYPVTNYIAMSGIGPDAAKQPAGTPGNGFMGYDRLTSLAMIKDGTANTIALMETRSDLGPWARGGPSNLRGFDPGDLPLCGDQRPFGGHTGGFNAAMADGSVRFISFSIEPAHVAAAVTIDGGEPVDLN